MHTTTNTADTFQLPEEGFAAAGTLIVGLAVGSWHGIVRATALVFEGNSANGIASAHHVPDLGFDDFGLAALVQSF